MNTRKIKRLLLILIMAVLMLYVLLDIHLKPIQPFLAVAFVAILPGYALATLIFYNVPLGILEKIGFGFGFSFGITALGGLLLNYLPAGIQQISWIIFLGGLTLIASSAVVFRATETPMADVDVSVENPPLPFHQLALMLVSLLLIVGAYFYSRAGAQAQLPPPTSRLWITWGNSEKTQAVIVIENQEKSPMGYQLITTSLSGLLVDHQQFVLNPGDLREFRVDVPDQAAVSDFVKASLYVDNNLKAPYLEVILWRADE